MAIYLSNDDLLREIVRSKNQGELTLESINYLRKMVKEIGMEFRYKHVEDKEDCASEAMLNVLKYWKNFDQTITSNAFAYFTQLIKTGYGIGYNKMYSKTLKTVPINISEKPNKSKGINNI